MREEAAGRGGSKLRQETVESPTYLARARQCVRCGLCLESCPFSHAWPPPGEIGTPRGKITMLRRFWEGQPALDEAAAAEFWYRCTACKACENKCPAGVSIVDLVIGARRHLVEQGRVPATAGAALRGIHLYGNPWRRPAEERDLWAAGLNLKKLSEGGRSDTVLHVCCLACYDPGAGRAARALAEILTISGVDFAIMGTDELCCGREVHSLGEEGLFERLVEKNLELFDRFGVRRVITLSPHCFDAFKNLYPGFGEVLHYTQLLRKLMREGRLMPRREAPFHKVTYFDPCHLGRYNGVYEEPREILKSIPGVEFEETVPSRGDSLCCSGGGGQMWFEAPRMHWPMPRELIDRAARLGAEVLAVACPFCFTNLEGEARVNGNAGPAVMDVAEMLRLCL